MINAGGETEAQSGQAACSCPFCPPLCFTTPIVAQVWSLFPPQLGPLLPVSSLSLSTCLSDTARNSRGCVSVPCAHDLSMVSLLGWRHRLTLQGSGALGTCCSHPCLNVPTCTLGGFQSSKGVLRIRPRLLERPPFMRSSWGGNCDPLQIPV